MGDFMTNENLVEISREEELVIRESLILDGVSALDLIEDEDAEGDLED